MKTKKILGSVLSIAFLACGCCLRATLGGQLQILPPRPSPASSRFSADGISP